MNFSFWLKFSDFKEEKSRFSFNKSILAALLGWVGDFCLSNQSFTFKINSSMRHYQYSVFQTLFDKKIKLISSPKV